MKTYKVVVAFGDGKPLETTITAKNCQDVQDVGFRSHPGARSIRLVSMLSEELPPVQQRLPHPFFDDVAVITSKPRGNARFTPGREATVEQAIKMRKGGMSYSKIATDLSVGKTTVRKWMFDAKVP